MENQLSLRRFKKWFTLKILLNLGFYAALPALMFIPSAKALLIRALMAMSFFQPEIPVASKQTIAVADISFTDNKGKQVNLSSLKGKVVFINFWAAWCPLCIAELPSINTLHKRLSADTSLVFLITDADGDFNRSLPFLARHHYNLPLYKTTSAVPETIMGNAIPTTVVISKTGDLVFRHDGAADYTNEKFIAYLKELTN